MRALDHKKKILKRLFDFGEKLTATDFSHVSNPNQYFVELEKMRLIKSEWGTKGNAKVKFRFVPSDYKDRVEKYLSHSVVTHESQSSL